MNNELTTIPKQTALQAMASRLNADPEELMKTLKDTVFKKASNVEFQALMMVANEYKLNPLTKEIYAFPAKGGGITPMVPIDGWMKIINRQTNLDGLEVDISDDGQSATCKIYIKGRSHPVKVTEYLAECKRNTEPWNTMPKRMLRHKAIMQAGRVAFGLSGIHDEDEANDISKREMRNVSPKAPIDPFKNKSLLGDEKKAEATPTETKAPEGKQKKARHSKQATLKGVAEKSSDSGKSFFVVSLDNGTKVSDFITFSQTLGKELLVMHEGSLLDIVYTVSEKGVLELQKAKIADGKKIDSITVGGGIA